MYKTDVELFEETYEIFNEQFQLCVDKRLEETKQKINSEFIVKPKLEQQPDPVLRLTFFREEVKNIEEDFFLLFDSFIHPYCNNISNNSTKTLRERFSVLHKGLQHRREDDIVRYTRGRGRRVEDAKADLLTLKGVYDTIGSDFRKRLNVKINEHNFFIERKKEKETVEKPVLSEKNSTDELIQLAKSLSTKIPVAQIILPLKPGEKDNLFDNFFDWFKRNKPIAIIIIIGVLIIYLANFTDAITTLWNTFLSKSNSEMIKQDSTSQSDQRK